MITFLLILVGNQLEWLQSLLFRDPIGGRDDIDEIEGEKGEDFFIIDLFRFEPSICYRS